MLKLDLLTAFETQPAAAEFAWPGFQCGTVGLLTVPDFKTRTRFALQVAAAQSGAAILVMNPEPTTVEQRVAWSGRLIAQGDRVRLDVRMRGGPSTFVQDFEFADTGLLCQARELEAA